MREFPITRLDEQTGPEGNMKCAARYVCDDEDVLAVESAFLYPVKVFNNNQIDPVDF